MQPSVSRRMAAATGLLAVAGLLVWAGPRPGDLPASGKLLDWFATTPADQSVVMLAGLAAELCLLYLFLSAALVVAGRLPGLAGRSARAVSTRVTPTLVRRTLESALGLTVATASVAAGSTPALAAASVARPPAAALLVSIAAPPSPLPSLDRPATPPSPATPPHSSPLATPPPPTPVAPPAPAATREVVVRRGDSLWRIAARQLGPGATDIQIATAWPRWYAANREVVGPDPNLLLPGQRLRMPS